ncbi:hypothetical protein FOJ82_05860 [Tessaracoccus rhinocerotis]|uniref:Calcineurin-like phosphoesterase domain-containing protein n=1 Tax=Tessaracoccus rhinocerotis TaxID=1689449 RepID=A0A553K1S0_9ACTN|nr:metallophosphoesterase [Tessaracoccus rhinocerotis]TRY18647.1 hypothetical protein FOJ82_05860 [Tessaracoccus rhinocerotis]
MSPTRRRTGALLATLALTGSLITASPAGAEPASPSITPTDGAWVSGTQTVTALPGQRGDDVTELALDGQALETSTDLGSAELQFDVGSNSIEARYGSYVLVNGNRVDLTERDWVSERGVVEFPAEWLVAGENTLGWRVGTFETSCGANHDDYVVADVAVVTGGPVTMDGDPKLVYSMGDGSCGTNATLLKEFDITFTVGDDPADTSGLVAEVDTTGLENGPHTVTATTAAGGTATQTINVNNDPADGADISIVDGSVLHGNVHVTAAPLGTPNVTGITLDGGGLDTAPTLGASDGVFRFAVGSNSADARYGNHVVVNGFTIVLDDTIVSETHELPVPGAYLVPGRNTVVFNAGTIESSCGTNYDDFNVTGVELVVDGTVATPDDVQDQYSFGDGNCGSNSSRLLTAEMNFDVAADGTGLRTALDTTALADGTHQLAATTASGAVSVRTFDVDNTAPVATSSITAGQHLTETTVLEVEATDPNGVEDLTITIDGAPVASGSLIGPELRLGFHELAITATDGIGNTGTTTIEFSTAEIPAGIIDLRAEETAEGIELSAAVDVTGGGSVSGTFYRAEAALAISGRQAEGTGIPDTLDFEGDAIPVDGLLADDEALVTSPASSGVTYQRFDVDVTDVPATDARAHWRGYVDPQRTATLYLWNTVSAQWEEAATGRGDSDAATVLTAPVATAHVDDSVVHALVAGSDPFADDIAKPVDDAFADPAEYDFAIAHFTDTQYLSEGAVEQETAEERAVWEKSYTDLTQWIVDNAQERKIAYAAHTGDIIENWIRETNDEANARAEWEVASRAQKILEDSGLPHGVLAGNHDNWTGTNHDLYNEYFGPEKYRALSEGWADAEFGGSFTEDDNQNHYDLFSAAGADFIAVYLSYGVDEADVAWANEVLGRYPERNAILLSHAYLTTSSEPDGRKAPYSNAGGLYQFRNIVSQNPNVFLTLSGHHHGVGLNVLTNVSEEGNHVVEMLADYQFYEIGVEELGLTEIGGYSPEQTLRFGASFLRMLQFDLDRSELVIDTYSPFLDNFNATEYDLEQRYDGTEDDLVVPIELNTRSTSIQTDAMLVLSPTDEVLGTDEGPADERLSTTVDAEVLQAWYLEAETLTGGHLVSGMVPAPGELFGETVPTEPEPSPEPSQEPTQEPTKEPTAGPTTPAVTDVYSTPGFHNVNGRWWYTECEPYSQTIRCTTDIWATSTSYAAGRFTSSNGWVFNNLTYLPYMTRAAWGSNPLANDGEWTAADGRQWRTECDTARTGRGGCRTWVRSDVVASSQAADGGWTHRQTKDWVLNNIVRFR